MGMASIADALSVPSVCALGAALAPVYLPGSQGSLAAEAAHDALVMPPSRR